MDIDKVVEAYAARSTELERVAAELSVLVKRALDTGPHPGHLDSVRFRVKHPTSFRKKVESPRSGKPYSNPLREIEDQIAGRALLFFRHDIGLANSTLKNALRDVEFVRQEPGEPDAFGYESDHWICLIPMALMTQTWRDQPDMPSTFELQIRTLFMHAFAEPQHDFGYKGSEMSRDAQRRLAWVAASAWGADQMFEEILEGLDLGDQQPSSIAE